MSLPRPLRTALPLLLAAAGTAPLAAAPAATAAPPARPPVRAAATAPADLGYDRIGVRRGGTWLLRDSLDGGPARTYDEGSAGWLPVAGDFDGSGTATVALFRNGVWELRTAARSTPVVVRFGQRGDLPVVGHFTAGGPDTIGVFRRGRWYLRSSNDPSPSTPSRTFTYGLAGDTPVVGDWSGGGIDGIGVRRGATWFERDLAGSGPTSRTFAFGLRGDLPVVGDWDHDGTDTPGLFRGGTWFFKRDSTAGGPYQTTRFGAAGDRPVVRRTAGLAPGLTHRVLRLPGVPAVAEVATVQLSAASSPDVVLPAGMLGRTQPVSTTARQAGAVLAVNGDYFLGDGRPVHTLAVDGRLVQSQQVLGRALGLDLSGTRVPLGFPAASVTLTLPSATPTAAPTAAPTATPSATPTSPPSSTSTVVTRWNSGAPGGDEVAAFTPAGPPPPADLCYAGLGPARNAVVAPDAGVSSDYTVTGTPRCFGPAPVLPPGGTVLAAPPGTSSQDLLLALRPGAVVRADAHLGFPGSVDVLGGNPVLLHGGARVEPDLTGPGDFFARQPRTAVGTTADGRMLVVTVDGRSSRSAGVTLSELADLLLQLGATDAINLDGGGSTTMVVNGLVANRPSDGGERPVATVLAVLPGPDPALGDLAAAPAAAASGRSLGRPGRPERPGTVAAGPVTGAADGSAAAAHDPGSLGGLADALARQGRPLTPGLQAARAAYQAARSSRPRPSDTGAAGAAPARPVPAGGR